MVLRRLLQPVVYVQLEPERVMMREVKSGRSVSGSPLAALATEPPQRLLAVGEGAHLVPAERPARVVNPFKHPRTLLADYTTAELVLRAYLKKLFQGRLFTPAPVMVLHPRVDPAGGFTEIEIRALKELAMGAGASQVVLWHGRDLRDDELVSLEFGSGGGKVL